jgi:hypothetical protein
MARASGRSPLRSSHAHPSVRCDASNTIQPLGRTLSGPVIGLLAVAVGLISGCAAVGAASPTATPLPGAVIHVDLRVPIASSGNLGGSCSASSFGSHTNAGTRLSTIPGATFTLGVLRGRVLAVETVPATGTVVAGGDDPVFRTVCSFKFDVPSDPTAAAYVFSVGKIYFPVPVASHDQLAATGWTATIGVNVDQ